jgi:hypothetical protein
MAGHYTLYIQGKYTPTPEEMHDWFGTPLPTTPTPTSTILPAPQQSFWTPTTTPPLTPQQQAEQTLMGQTTPQQQIAQSLGLQPSQINPVVNNAAINYNLTPTQALQQEASGGQVYVPTGLTPEQQSPVQEQVPYSPVAPGYQVVNGNVVPVASLAYQTLTGQLDTREQVAQNLGVSKEVVNPVLGRPYQPVYPQGSVAERVATLEGKLKKTSEWEKKLQEQQNKINNLTLTDTSFQTAQILLPQKEQKELPKPILQLKPGIDKNDYEALVSFQMGKYLATGQASGRVEAITPEDILLVMGAPAIIKGVGAIGLKSISLLEGKRLVGSEAENTLAILSRTKFVTSPKTVALVDKEGVLASTTFRVNVGKVFKRQYELTSDVRITQQELSSLVKEAEIFPKLRGGVNSKVSLPEKAGINYVRLAEPQQQLLLSEKVLERNLGKEITDLIETNKDLVKFREKVGGFSEAQVNKLRESLGEIVLSKSEGIARIRNVGLVERFVNSFRGELGVEKSVSVARYKALTGNKVVTVEIKGLDLTQVSGRKIVLPKGKKEFGVNVYQGNKLDLRRLTETKSGLPKVVSKIESGFYKILGEETKAPNIKSYLSGTKGRLITKEIFKDESVLTSEIKTFKTQDLILEFEGQKIKLSRVKVEGLPEQKIVEKQFKESQIKNIDDWQTQTKNVIKKIGKGKEPSKLNEPQKRLQAPKVGTPTGDEFNFSQKINQLGIKSPSPIKPEDLTGALANLPKNILRQSGKGLATLEKQSLNLGSNISSKASGGTALLLKTQQVAPQKSVTLEKVVQKEKVGTKQGKDFKGIQTVRVSNAYVRVPKLSSSFYLKSIPIVKVGQFGLNKSSTASLSAQSQKVSQFQNQSQIPSVSISTAQAITPATSTRTFQKQAQAFSTSSTKQLVNQRTPSVTNVIPKIRTPPVKIPVRIPFPSGENLIPLSKRLKGKKGFNVFSRVKGKKVKIGSNLPRNLALAVGKRFTGETTARSFRIEEAGVTTQSDIALPGLYEYRIPKPRGRVAREGFTFVERSKFAIDTIGEKQQLKLARQKSLAF